jgi:hypothetical protein
MDKDGVSKEYGCQIERFWGVIGIKGVTGLVGQGGIIP